MHDPMCMYLVILLSGVSDRNNVKRWYEGTAREAAQFGRFLFLSDMHSASPEFMGFSIQSKWDGKEPGSFA